ncbi:MAG: MFS transporter [Alphaproteobacteria bacterium]|nr:MFS transporter [Rickettsiaceae bacterium]NBU53087.1 MFS transporter [Alphaproteobacteria bacterium]NBY35739.1 MFS transporter [Alphaproteobacteria bacterium]
MRKEKKKIIGAFLGTVVEYYDYSLYGFSASIIALKFFPELEKIQSLMYVFGIYAISYISKPLGSLIFSFIGDFYGRLISLRITIIGIAIPTFTIGILPDFNSIGVTAAYILIICRFMQGFFVGGEYDGAAIYVIEHLGKKYHYTASAITRASGVIGLLLGIAVTNLFNSSLFPNWAWRVPFILSLPLAFLTIYCRKFLTETPDFSNSIQQKIEINRLASFIKHNSLTLLLAILLAGGFGVTYQLSIIFMRQYLPIVMPATSTIITSFSIFIVFIFGVSMPIAGFLADKIGEMIVVKISLLLTLTASGLLGIAIYYQLMNLALISTIILAISVAPFNALAHGIIIKAFSVNERYRGISLGHTIGSMLMSGTAAYISLYFMKEYKIMLFPIIYIALSAIIAFFVIYKFSEKHRSH